MKLNQAPLVEVVRDGISVNGVVTPWSKIDAARQEIQTRELPNNPKAIKCEICGEYVPRAKYEKHLQAHGVKNADLSV